MNEERINRIESDIYKLYTKLEGIHDEKGLEARVVELEKYLFNCCLPHNPHECGRFSHRHGLYGLQFRIQRLEDSEYYVRLDMEKDRVRKAEIERIQKSRDMLSNREAVTENRGKLRAIGKDQVFLDAIERIYSRNTLE
jgi:hypothetical protein